MDKGLYYRYSGRLLMGMEYNMMRVCYDDALDKHTKLNYILVQYAEAINQLRSEITDTSRDINLDPQQLEDIFTSLAAKCIQYIHKVRGISLNQAFAELFEDSELAEKLKDINNIMEVDDNEE